MPVRSVLIVFVVISFHGVYNRDFVLPSGGHSEELHRSSSYPSTFDRSAPDIDDIGPHRRMKIRSS